jgi:polysaccharide biosynthesis transport protein
MDRPSNLASSSIWRPTGQRPAPPQMSAGMTPKEAMDIVRRHVLLICIMTIVGFIVGGTAWALLRQFYPRYTAWTYIEVLPPGLQDPKKVESPLASKEILYAERSSKAALIKQQSLYDELLKREEVRSTKWFEGYRDDLDKLRKVLEDDLGATAERDTNYIRISMVTCSPKESALIVNQAVDLFVARQTMLAQAGVGGRLAELNKQLTEVESDLSSAENQIETIRKNAALAGLTGVVSRENADIRNAITTKLQALEIQQNELVTRIAQTQTTVETYQKYVTGPISPQIQRQMESDPVMIALANQKSALEADLARKRGTLGDDHRDVKQTEEAIKRIAEQRRDREAQLGETYRQEQYYRSVDDLKAMGDELKKLEEMRAGTELKQKDLERYQIIYEQSVSKRDELRKRKDEITAQITTYKLIYGDPETPQVKRAGYAPEPLKMSSPKWQLFFPGGLALGMLSGIGLAFLIEMLNDLVRTPSDVKRYLQTPLLGVIYHVEEDEQVQGVDLCHVIRQAPHSITGECYRQFKTNLKLSAPPETLKSILVTSGQAGEGTTCAASNLAETFAAEGKRVLFVDANLRRPTSRTTFPPISGDAVHGLGDVLAGQCQLVAAIRSTGLEGFDVLDAGTPTRSPAELIGSQAMRQVLVELERTYDHIIIDGPPVLLVSEAKTLASMVRSTVLVFSATSTTRGAAGRTIRELGEIHANVVGCMLMQARSLKGGYFQELYKSYEDYHSGQLTAAAR